MTASATEPDPDDDFADEELVREIVIDCGGGRPSAPQEEEPDDVLQFEEEEVTVRIVYPDQQN
jgi:hypothetical protein